PQRLPVVQRVLDALPALSRTKTAVPGVFTPLGKQAPNSAIPLPISRTPKVVLWAPSPLTTKTLLFAGVKSPLGSKKWKENLQKSRALSPPHMSLSAWQRLLPPTRT